MLPTVFIENLRALGVVTIDIEKNGGPKFKNQTWIRAPVYGTYDDYRSQYNYNITINGEEVSLYNLTPENGGTFRQSDLLVTGLEESNIYINPSGEPLAEVIKGWNDWVGGLTSSIQMDTFAPESTPRLLKLTQVSRLTTAVSVQQNQELRDKPKKIQLTRKQRSGSKTIDVPYEVTPYSQRHVGVTQVKPIVGTTDYQEISLCSNQCLPAPIYTMINNWVTPKYVFSDIESAASVLNQEATRINIFEPYNIPSSTSAGQGRITLSTHWQALAESVTAPGIGLDAIPMTKVLDEMNKAGVGGFFGSLIGEAAAAATGVPLLAGLGSLLPF